MASGPRSGPERRKRWPGLQRYYVTPFFAANAVAALGAVGTALRARDRGDRAAALNWTVAGLTHAAVVAHGPRNCHAGTAARTP